MFTLGDMFHHTRGLCGPGAHAASPHAASIRSSRIKS
jgi:hypothetical protein